MLIARGDRAVIYDLKRIILIMKSLREMYTLCSLDFGVNRELLTIRIRGIDKDYPMISTVNDVYIKQPLYFLKLKDRCLPRISSVDYHQCCLQIYTVTLCAKLCYSAARKKKSYKSNISEHFIAPVGV